MVKYFTVGEMDNSSRQNIAISKTTHRRLKALAALEGTPLYNMLEGILNYVIPQIEEGDLTLQLDESDCLEGNQQDEGGEA